MIFRYPTLINFTSEHLDNKIDFLMSYEQIDKEHAYEMIKKFPVILGYDIKRTKGQLDLLRDENLIDYIIQVPSKLMNSEELLYALIEFAKKRYHVSDLSRINGDSIFVSNATLKKSYGVSFEEIKKMFPYKSDTALIQEEVFGEVVREEEEDNEEER